MSFIKELRRRNVFKVALTYGIVAWLLLQVSDTLVPALRLPDWFNTGVAFVLIIGFPIAMIFAWAFEMTPEGVKREKDVDRSKSVARQTGHKLNHTIIALLVLVLAYFIWDKFNPETIDENGGTAITNAVADPQKANTTAALTTVKEITKVEPSIAVLPFVNMSSDKEQEFFSDGISEEILNVLTRIPNLKVAARTSSFQFKGKNQDIQKIAQQLKVNHVLEGSVRKSGKTLRITAQLIETDTGFHLWSETFDRQLEDVFAVQDEIAGAIAQELRIRLTEDIKKTSQSIDLTAYDLYLKARSLVAARGILALKEGISLLNSSLKIEPDYAPALATLAKAYAVLPFFSRNIDNAKVRELARIQAEKALALDPDNTEALSALAIVYAFSDLNWSGARQLLDKALKTNPGSLAANNFMGDVTLRIGDFKSALKYESRAAELDPLSPVQLTDLSVVKSIIGQPQQAIDLAERALALNPVFYQAHYRLLDAYFRLGRLDKLEELSNQLDKLPNIWDDLRATLNIRLLQAKGKEKQLQIYLTEILADANTGKLSPSFAARAATMTGHFDQAGQMLLQAYAEKDGNWISPIIIRLPEQAPKSKKWQAFWQLPGVAELAELRRSYGLSPHQANFGSAAKPQ